VSSAGQEAVELAEAAGLHLDDWQQWVLGHLCAESDDGKWAAFEAAVVVPRQNGKGVLLAARELAGLFLFDDQLVVHSAHEFATSLEHFHRILALLEDHRDLGRRIKRVSRSHGDEGIELTTGQRMRFRTRTKGGGRGFSADLVVIDEAMVVPEASLGALLPTLSARPNPQVVYAGSSVDQEVHEHGVVLSRLRERALSGDDPSLFYAEWSVNAVLDEITDDEAADKQNWSQANPALGARIAEPHVEDERRSMPLRTFAVERLGVGDWPRTTPGAPPLIDPERWAACAGSSAIEGRKVFAVDIPLDRATACIAAAGQNEDGLPAVDIVQHEAGTAWVVDRIVELVDKHGGEVVVDDHGPASSLIPELERREVPLLIVDMGEVAAAAGQFYDAVQVGGLRHGNQRPLNDAVAGAVKRPLGERWTFGRKGAVDVAPLVAGMLALFGLINAEPEEMEPLFAVGPSLTNQ
jgi:hypothetical protein